MRKEVQAGTKERVLEALAGRQTGGYCSGARLASELSVSRAAVWKAIRSLREEGWQIEAVTNRGYRLAPDAAANDRLSVEGMRPYLPDGYDPGLIRICDTIDSTNRLAKQMAVAGAPSGTAVLAETQTAGSGHRRHSFSSPRGGLYLSILLRPGGRTEGKGNRTAAERNGGEEGPERWESGDALTLSVARLVSDVIHRVTGRATRVKPVNDLYLGDRKVCGILTEAGADFDTGELEWMVIGIGINVSTRPEDFPEEIRMKAGSLYGEGEKPVSRSRLAAELLTALMRDVAEHPATDQDP